MKVAYITAGAAGMYCGSCMRDNTLVRALRREGAESLLVPTYTPIRTDVEDVSEPRIFFGGLGVYLTQKFSWWKNTPAFLSRALARPAFLKLLSRIAVDNQPEELGELTLSVLRGEKGKHLREVDEITDWLAEEIRPDVVHLTNALFSGLAPTLKKRLGVPIICTLQGEDLFLEGLDKRYLDEALATIRENAQAISCFVAVSDYYRYFMSEYLGIPLERIRVVPPAIPREVEDALAGGNGSRETGTIRIGYLARLAREKGLELLADAFIILKQQPGTEKVKLSVAGYLGPADRHFVDSVRAKFVAAGLTEDVDVLGTLDYEEKRRFFSKIDIFSVPSIYREAKGLYILEAFASALPVVLPRHGAFVELVEKTGGGILVDPNSPESLADGLHYLVEDEKLRKELGKKGREGLGEHFTDTHMARATLEIYRSVLDSDSCADA